jgi:pimeloyl-ACP methyl ester carboxylesterase
LHIPIPSRWAVLNESRFFWDVASSMARLPQLASHPRGAGDPVLVLPGFGAGDTSTVPLRAFLRMLGHDAHGWGLGTNGGDVVALLPRVIEQIERRAVAAGTRVRLVGWSLGGVIAREAARDRPDLVERIVTLGSPVVGGPKYTAARRAYQLRGGDLDAIEAAVTERERVPLRVPVTAIYSKSDGIVAWQACIDRYTAGVEHIEVSSSHVGLGIHAEVYALVAQRLAIPRDTERRNSRE